MQFRTEVEIESSKSKIEHNHKIFLIGSCFAENISKKLNYFKFGTLLNPTGIIYNPISIYNTIDLINSNKIFEKNDLIYHNGEFHSFYHHSDFSSHDPLQSLEKINSSLKDAREFLKASEWIVISLGTALVFEFINEKRIVSNCHKIPAKEFKSFRLNLHETVDYISRMITIINQISPHAKIILTVSPIRHWKNGAVENQLSKSTLLLAVNEVVKNIPIADYFPSYEILMDDLRDYRFFASDLLHPSEQAVNYIWEKFSTTYFSDDCFRVMNEIKKIV
ncbi:MAG: GSCFA domain-containing protein, partial [Melioribacteraceae bacterium]|nr:GSCFA domain-containing protein [Melioribacteraceae bacterium]